MNPITGLLAALGALTAFYIAAWSKAANGPTATEMTIGAVTNFFDALGIGSFATTTAAFKFLNLVPDRVIPGTLNAGHALPTITQAFIFTAVIPVDVLTLISMIVAAVLGAWLGAGIVARWSKRKVEIGMGCALLAAAAFMLMRQLNLFPPGSDAIGVRGMTLALAVIGNFGLGALMTLGIGLYAPCMILVSLLGMSERTAFPIMMGSCAFLMPVGSLRFIRAQSYSLRAAVGLAIGGVPGVLLAGLIVKQLSLTNVRWLVIVVVIYAAATMLYSAFSHRDSTPVGPPEA